MGAVIPAGIFGLEGQVIKEVVMDEASGRVRIVHAGCVRLAANS